jgi:hypothetical protein
MPRICQFHGIVIYVHWRDHNPPHFHAVHGEDELVIEMHQLRRMRGRLPRTVERLVWKWARLHREELLENWALAQKHEALNPVDPLD